MNIAERAITKVSWVPIWCGRGEGDPHDLRSLSRKAGHRQGWAKPASTLWTYMRLPAPSKNRFLNPHEKATQFPYRFLKEMLNFMADDTWSTPDR